MSDTLGVLLAVALLTYWLLLDHGDDGWEYPVRPLPGERRKAQTLAYRIDPGMPDDDS